MDRQPKFVWPVYVYINCMSYFTNYFNQCYKANKTVAIAISLHASYRPVLTVNYIKHIYLYNVIYSVSCERNANCLNSVSLTHFVSLLSAVRSIQMEYQTKWPGS